MKYAILLALAACGGGPADTDDMSSDDTSLPDGALPDGAIATPDSPPGCNVPSVDQAWVKPFVLGAVTDLASRPRFTDSERQAARNYLVGELQDMGLTAELQDFPNGENVVVTIPATEETEDPVIVGAHFDTVESSPGADDNASGSAVVLAVARFATMVTCRKSDVTFVWFDKEEEGLFGSRAYAMQHDPAKVRAVHTFDMVGFNDDGDHVLEIEQPTAALEAEWRAAAPIVGATISVTDSGSTDHEAFRNHGYAADGLCEEYAGGDTTPNYHTEFDTVDTLDPNQLALAAKLAAQVVITEIRK